MAEPVEVIRASALAGVPHGFLGRRGGVSGGVTAGLNVGLGSADDPDAVAENRRLAVDAVQPGAQLACLYQIHSSNVVTVRECWDEADRPRGDGMVTDRPGIVLGILTADCAPVLFADSQHGIVGAAHAGWRGAHGGVIEATIAAMEALGARRENIAAAIGPCIAQESYEVGEDFRREFSEEDGRFFTAGRAGHWQFALEDYVAARLQRAEIARIEPLGLDTYSNERRFFSYRRSTHLGQDTYGREFSLIGLPQ
ncbi:peptidoglycan editing factor PgeF [Altericroceibacterium endophyticum]|uniref:Purine nucleoside phosphorylase n=1 Tax=Altericroceibacterium endophyticum TaxID=1808508 RepID=A0A6I4T4X7_9SPHN|nr:peptidoglycan editing factor PgeF [Altericroceibacterium endophyticum]MXO65738.1 peptidoglycan editing factor PgeF [Altericroceibacterium endophyticum]